MCYLILSIHSGVKLSGCAGGILVIACAIGTDSQLQEDFLSELSKKRSLRISEEPR